MSVQVLISTYNGGKFLREQIDSLIYQAGVNVKILVRDDDSTDNTMQILRNYEQDGKLSIIKGKNLGWRRSFMELIYNSPDADYYAFCDQDDIWKSEKLKKAVDVLESMPKGQPNLYCSNLIYYKNGKEFGLIRKNAPKLNLHLALMRSLSAGCTMVFNKELRNLVADYRPKQVTAHDFWLYQVASLLGNVYYDMNSYILYRQHSDNQIGASISKKSIWKKRIESARKNFMCNDRQFAAKELLRLYGPMITDENRKSVESVAYFDRNFFSRLKLFFDRKFTMGNFSNDIWLRVRILFGKI